MSCDLACLTAVRATRGLRVSRVCTSRVAIGLLCAVGAAALGPSVASAKLTTVGLGGWQVQSSARTGQSGAQISSPRFSATLWLQVRPDDAGAVGTEVGALVQSGHCRNVSFSTNMRACFGYMSRRGPDTIPMFSVPWWFRTTFTSELNHAEHAQLIINGVVGEADVWLNGHRVASRATVQGDYTRYTFDITRLVRHGINGLALKLYPNDPNTMFHRRQPRLDPDSAGQQHRHPVSDPAAHVGVAGAEQRARGGAERPRPLELGADAKGGCE
jgi:exo-1,4-beta-D-glucosaminidase